MTTNVTGYKRKYESPPTSSPVKSRKKVALSKNCCSAIEGGCSPSELEERIRLHAQERIQTLGILYYTYYRKWVRSDGGHRDIKISIGSAKVQVGTGTQSDHAAHSNPCSGVRDNYLRQALMDVEKEQKVTPITNKVLSRLGNLKSTSLIDNSELAFLLNGTHVLPRAVNLQVDCPLERHIRPKIEKWLEQVGVGTLTPDQALVSTKEAIELFFTEQLARLTDEKVHQYTELELKGVQELDLNQLNLYLFSEFKDNNGNVDFDATLRLLQHL